MLMKSLKLAGALALLGVVGACDGTTLMEPDAAVETPPVARTACMAGGGVASRAGCPGTAGAVEVGLALLRCLEPIQLVVAFGRSGREHDASAIGRPRRLVHAREVLCQHGQFVPLEVGDAQ